MKKTSCQEKIGSTAPLISKRSNDAPDNVIYIGTPYKYILEERRLAEGLASLMRKDYIKNKLIPLLETYFDQENPIPKKSFQIKVPKDYLKQNISSIQERRLKKAPSSLDFNNTSSTQILFKQKNAKTEKILVMPKPRKRTNSDKTFFVPQEKIAEYIPLPARKKFSFSKIASFGQITEVEQEVDNEKRALDPSNNPLACPNRIQRKHRRAASLPNNSQKIFRSLNDVLHEELKDIKNQLGSLALTSPEIESKKYQNLQIIHNEKIMRDSQFANRMRDLRNTNRNLLDEFLNFVEQPVQNVPHGIMWVPKRPSQLIPPSRKISIITKFT